MNHFIFPYAGNKRKEFQIFNEYIKYDGIISIIEPFVGSAAISFNIWKEHGNKFNYYLNDNDKHIYETYLLLKKENIEDIFKKINDIKKTVKTKEDFLKIYKKEEHSIYEYIYFRKASSFRLGLFDEQAISKSDYKPTKLLLEFVEFIKLSNVFITNDDWSISYNKYKDDDKSIIFLDPPYIASCNTMYGSYSVNMYEYISENNIKNNIGNIYLILENIWIIKMLFKENNILVEYDKKYEMSKKKTSHILISNK
jgi:site-specific DNA-adenine methylase